MYREGFFPGLKSSTLKNYLDHDLGPRGFEC